MSTDYSLDSLMAELEQKANIAGMSKQASEDDKSSKEGKGNEEDSKTSKENTEKDVETAKKDLDKTKEDLDKLKKDEGQTKEAQASGEQLFKEVMEKVASANLSTTNTSKTKETKDMNKQASVAGKALADALLEKLANAGDQNTVSGIPEGVAPGKNQVDAAAQVSEQDAVIKPLPTKDAIGNGGGSINQIFDAIVADALGQGAATPNELAHVPVSGAEGSVVAQGTPNQVQTESVEKTAAVISLVNSGFDFDEAVDMVKAAAEQIEAEEVEQVKQAAFASLIEQGVDFELAAAMVKSAGVMDTLKGAGSAAKNWVQNQAVKASVGAENVAFGLKNHSKDIATRGIKQLAGNRLVQGAAGVGALGTAGGAYALSREKQAAVSALCEAGVDFSEAVDLVQAKSAELYGA